MLVVLKDWLILALALLLVSKVELISSRRLSLKDSLTAYAEEDDPIKPYEKVSYSLPESINQEETKRNDHGSKKFPNSGFGREGKSDNDLLEHLHHPTSLAADRKDGFTSPNLKPVQKQPSLWELTKNMLFSFQQKGNERFITGNSTPAKNDSGSKEAWKDSGSSRGRTHSHSPTKEMKIAKQQDRDNSLTVKNELGSKTVVSSDNKTATNKTLNGGNFAKEFEKQPRTKKEVGSAGLRDILWNTANALWSVNKEHFLPTFLHTKTGGKLSLVRDSIFKPITILSQFRTGVQEINNEKWKNLDRLTSSGSGWSSPDVFVVKTQPHANRLLTLARYGFRLGKHTLITKYKLKRALADLQFRALRKILRIIANKNIGQKIATIRILVSGIWKGKRALLRIFTGRSNPPEDGYPGKDNSMNVDITYHPNNNEWLTDTHSHEYIPPPPPPSQSTYYSEPSPPQDTYYSPPQDSYHPLSPQPSPDIHTNYYHSPENSASLPLFPPSPSLDYTPPVKSSLIETPSYASLLKIMGINPSSYDYKPEPEPTTTTKAPYFYYPTNDYNQQSFKRPIIEKPAASYSYHYRKPQNTDQPYDLYSSSSSSLASYLRNIKPKPLEDNPVVPQESKTSSENSSGVTATPFRLKLLEAMSAGALQ